MGLWVVFYFGVVFFLGFVVEGRVFFLGVSIFYSFFDDWGYFFVFLFEFKVGLMGVEG